MSEIQTAAERWRKHREAKERLASPYRDGTKINFSLMDYDELTLAEAYLAEHPADDGEAIDEAWLRSVSFMQESGFYFFRTAQDGLGRVKWLKKIGRAHV